MVLLGFLILIGPFATVANAALTLTFRPESNGTRLQITGSLDTTGLNFSGPLPFTSNFRTMDLGYQLAFTVAPGGYFAAEHRRPVSAWHSVSSTDLTLLDVSGGDFLINDRFIAIPEGYVSGEPFYSSFLIDGVSLQDMGLQEGIILSLANGDTVSVTAIPEPSGTMLVGLASFGLMLLRDRKRGRMPQR